MSLQDEMGRQQLQVARKSLAACVQQTVPPGWLSPDGCRHDDPDGDRLTSVLRRGTRYAPHHGSPWRSKREKEVSSWVSSVCGNHAHLLSVESSPFSVPVSGFPPSL